MTTPLPRSLEPASGEVLPSFLLRLAYRLGVSPHDLAERCGLFTDQPRLSPRHLLRAEPAFVESLARACRLTEDEIGNMTLERQTPHFPPLRPAPTGAPRYFATVVNEGWVFTLFSRFCPQCLADDTGLASPGTWPGTWRLPMTVACPRHQRLLEWRCPECESPAFSSGRSPAGRWRPASLIPNPLAKVHPAACRSRPAGRARRSGACGTRLDLNVQPGVFSSDEVLAVQEHLLQLVVGTAKPEASSVGRSVATAEYLHDLRAVMMLICGTWPATAALLPKAPQLDAVDAHVEGQNRAMRTRAADGLLAVTARVLDSPPLDAGAAAALITLSTRLLTAPDAAAGIGRLLAECDLSWPGRLKLLRLAPHCSQGFRTTVDSHLDTLGVRPLGRVSAFPQPFTHQQTLQHQHIPQRLPDAWFALLQDLGAPERHLRRDAAVRLVQMGRGGSRRETAIYLGVTTASADMASAQLKEWHQTRDNARRYQHALEQLADAIASSPDPVDYQRRREYLAHWVLPPDDWQNIIEAVRRRQTRQDRTIETLWSATTHLAASAVVWAQTTNGEPAFAPTASWAREPADAISAEAARQQARGWHHPRRNTGFHRLLTAVLREYSDELAARIDTPCGSDPWHRPLPGSA